MARVARTVAIALGLAVAPHAASASNFDANDGQVEISDDAIASYDFENALATAAVLRVIHVNTATWTYDTATADELAPFLTGSVGSGSGDAPIAAIEGSQALHFRAEDGYGFAIEDAATFAAVANQRIVVSFWGFADGMEPFLAVTYGSNADLPVDQAWAWARIPAIRTGRETSDGWVEYSTGAIDGSILTRPIHDLTISARVPDPDEGTTVLLENGHTSTRTTDAVAIDAIEILAAPGAIQAGACTALTVDTACGAGGECAYGQCVDAAVEWQPVPPVAMQQEIAARVVQWAEHLMGDRTAIAGLGDAWTTATLALASDGATPRAFWGGLSAQVVAIRDTHTRLGRPYNGISTPFAVRPDAASGPLDLCFGPTVNDFADGNLAYAVWSVGAGNVLGLRVGDVITAIDGVDPKTWVETVYPRYTYSLPTEADVDWAPSAHDLATLLAMRAGTITVQRCSVAGVCGTLAPFDVATAALAAISEGNYADGSMVCDDRFTELIAGSHTDSEGGDALLASTLDANTLGMQFDGFEPNSESVFTSAIDAAFTKPHADIIVDTREGHGGYDDMGDYLFQQLRGSDEPAVLALAARGAFDDPDPASLFSYAWDDCIDGSSQCDLDDIYIYEPATGSAVPPGESSNVAWLDTDDVSNNDMVPRLLQGRANLRIFAPFPTYGALGSNIPLPPLMQNWIAGSVAISDSRYGTTIDAAEAATSCQSGHGVVPDQVVAQTLSDVLAGRDTMVDAAYAWLATAGASTP